jgi:hypothetical protein
LSRRKKLELPAEGQIRFFATTIVCSDRNQHLKTVVAPPIMDSRQWAQGEILWQTGGESPITDWRPADGSKTFRFRCKRCDRDVRLTRDALGRLFDALGIPEACRERRTEIDISLIRLRSVARERRWGTGCRLKPVHKAL